MIILMQHNMVITCLISVYVVFETFLTHQFKRRNIVYFKKTAHCVCVSVWDSLVWVCESECVLCVGKIGEGLWK